MSDEIIKVLNDLGNRLGMVIDWNNQNVVPYLQEIMTRFINFRNAQAILWIIVSLIILGLGTLIIIKLNKWRKSDKYNDYNDDVIYLFSIVGIIFLVFIFLIVLICNINGLFQNIFIPELTIINYIQGRI